MATKITSTGKVAFIGCGAMGEAILKGIVKAKLAAKSDLVASVPTAQRRAYLEKQYDIKTYEDNAQAVAGADFVVLAVKPQMAKTAITAKMVKAIPAKATVI